MLTMPSTHQLCAGAARFMLAFIHVRVWYLIHWTAQWFLRQRSHTSLASTKCPSEKSSTTPMVTLHNGLCRPLAISTWEYLKAAEPQALCRCALHEMKSSTSSNTPSVAES
eukprot:3119895-Amphidinium_carterae.1